MQSVIAAARRSARVKFWRSWRIEWMRSARKPFPPAPFLRLSLRRAPLWAGTVNAFERNFILGHDQADRVGRFRKGHVRAFGIGVGKIRAVEMRL